MQKVNIHKGWLKLVEDSNCHETIELNGEPIAEELEYLSGNIATVRYYISDKEATEEELQEDFLINTLYGNLESKYGAVYSEYTGYLWTNDDLKVGGHDLLSELESYNGKYLYLIVEIDMEVYKKKEMESEMRYYGRILRDLISSGNRLGKSIEDIVLDIKKLR